MVAIVYSRVSSEDQARTGFSLTTQIEAGRRRAAELGAIETICFSDEGVPGDVLERPGLQGALEAVRRRGASFFICYDPDRLARSLSLQLLVTDQIERAGARLEFVSFDYKQTPEGQLFYSLRGAIAQFEKAKIRERTMRGKRQKAREGGLTHNPNIYGYHFDPVQDTLRVHEEQARVVQLIFHWFLTEDLGPWAIAQRLTAMGIAPARAGKGWHHSSVRSILRNQSYTGVLQQQKWDYSDTHTNKYRPRGEKVKRKLRPQSEWIPVPIPAIIDKASLEAARAKLENARRWWSGWRSESYLISGLCTCLLCGRPIYGASRASGGRRIRYYVCRGYAPGTKGAPRCAFGRIRAEEVEAEVWQAVRTLILQGGYPEKVCSQLDDEDRCRDELALVQKQLAEVDSEQERTVRLLVRGAIPQALGDQLLTEQRSRRSALAQQAARLSDRASVARQAEAMQEECAPLLDRLSFQGRQQAVRALVKAIQLSREETILHVRLGSVAKC